MEAVRCDLCGVDDPIPFISTRDRYSGKLFNLSMCKNCNLVYLNPRPTMSEITDYYPGEYEAYFLTGEKGSKSSKFSANRNLLKQLKYVQQFHPRRGVMLDIGCATGNFLNVARNHGWQVLGVETNEKAANIAREAYGLKIVTSDLEHSDIPTESVDAVTMWDVLEHLHSPKESLKTINKILRAGGMIFFSIPNLDSYDRHLFRNEWIGWDAPRHFNLFDSSNIRRLLNDTGFRLINQKCITGGKGTFLLNLERLSQGKPTLQWVLRFYPVVSLILWPYRQFSYMKLRGPIVTYAVQKT